LLTLISNLQSDLIVFKWIHMFGVVGCNPNFDNANAEPPESSYFHTLIESLVAPSISTNDLFTTPLQTAPQDG
jgi:hypothetical protein